MAEGRATNVAVQTHIDATPGRVWESLADIASHVDWMSDAVWIRFEGGQRRGVGTRFVCRTKVGVFTLSDTMEITEWKEFEAIGVRHKGRVSGQGRFEIAHAAGGGTMFSWCEELHFPRWAGRPGAAVARATLGRIWRRNLEAFKESLESGD